MDTRTIPRYEVPNYHPSEESPQDFIDYFETECDFYEYDEKIKYMLLSRVIRRTSESTSAMRSHWRHAIVNIKSYSDLKTEFISFFSSSIDDSTDYETKLATIEQMPGWTAKQYSVQFEDYVVRAQRARKKRFYPEIDGAILVRYFMDGIRDDLARQTVYIAGGKTWHEAANVLEEYEKKVPARRRFVVPTPVKDSIASRVRFDVEGDSETDRRGRDTAANTVPAAYATTIALTPPPVDPVHVSTARVPASEHDRSMDHIIDRLRDLEIKLNTERSERRAYETRKNDERKAPVDRSRIVCYRCREVGHYANECMSEKVDANTQRGGDARGAREIKQMVPEEDFRC